LKDKPLSIGTKRGLRSKGREGVSVKLNRQSKARGRKIKGEGTRGKREMWGESLPNNGKWSGEG